MHSPLQDAVSHGLFFSQQIFTLQYKKDKELQEGVQRRDTKTIRGMEHLPYEETLWASENTEGDLINTYKYLKGGCEEDGVGLFKSFPVTG